MTDLSTILDALHLTPDSPAAWQAYANRLADNGRDDEAAAIRVYSSAMADTVAVGVPVAEVLRQLKRNAARLGWMARKTEERSYGP